MMSRVPNASRYRLGTYTAYLVVAQYSYSYAGREFQAKCPMAQLLSSRPADADRLASQYSAGKELKLYVNPVFPSQSTLHPGDDLGNAIVVLICAGILTWAIVAVQFPGRPGSSAEGGTAEGK